MDTRPVVERTYIVILYSPRVPRRCDIPYLIIVKWPKIIIEIDTQMCKFSMKDSGEYT